jgi:hypothetical protein
MCFSFTRTSRDGKGLCIGSKTPLSRVALLARVSETTFAQHGIVTGDQAERVEALTQPRACRSRQRCTDRSSGPRAARPSVNPVHAAAIAPGLGVVKVKIRDAMISQKAADRLFDLGAGGDITRDHQAGGVVGADGHQAGANHFRHLTDVKLCDTRADADIDRPAAVVWAADLMMHVVEKDDLLADGGILQADAAGVAGV